MAAVAIASHAALNTEKSGLSSRAAVSARAALAILLRNAEDRVAHCLVVVP